MRAALALVAVIAVGITGMDRLFAAEATPPALRPCVVLTGADSLVKSPGYVRVESEKEWASVWHHHKGVEETKEHDAFFNPLGLPGIDFDRYMVIAVFCGSGWNSAGVTVASLTEERERLLLRFQGKWYQTAGPDGGGRPACAYGFLVLPRTEKTVVLEENVQHLIGGPPVWKERASLAQGRPAAGAERAPKPEMKGVELYSWKPEGKDWHFSLLRGTNRLKTTEEITHPDNAIVGVAALKKRLTRLAEGESVFWRHLDKEPMLDDLARDLKAFCEGIRVKLQRV